MSEAYQCDRCGTTRPGTPAYTLHLGEGIGRSRRGDERVHEYKTPEIPAQLDMCQACHNDLKAYWKEAGGDAENLVVGSEASDD